MQTKGEEKYHNIRNVILLQTLFCINRSHWFDQRINKTLGNIFFYTTLATIIGFNVYEILTYFYDESRLDYLAPSTKLFAYIFQYLLLIDLIPLSIYARRCDNFHEKLRLLDEKCEKKPVFTIKPEETKVSLKENSKMMIVLSLISAVIDLIGLIVLEYPAGVVATLPIAFAAHDTEMLLYSLIIKEFNAKLATLMDESAEVGTKIYRHLLISASHFTEDFRFTIALMVLITLATTIMYIGVAVVLEGPRTQRVLAYLIWRELRSLLSLWILCSASYKTRTLSNSFIKRLTERVVFEVDLKDQSSRELTKRWLRCAKSLQVSYLTSSCYSLDPALPLGLLDYTTNYLLIIVQAYPLIK